MHMSIGVKTFAIPLTATTTPPTNTPSPIRKIRQKKSFAPNDSRNVSRVPKPRTILCVLKLAPPDVFGVHCVSMAMGSPDSIGSNDDPSPDVCCDNMSWLLLVVLRRQKYTIRLPAAKKINPKPGRIHACAFNPGSRRHSFGFSGM